MKRPKPPARLCEYGKEFEPAPALEAWIRKTFIESTGPLHNPEHDHLNFALIGLLWTNAANVKRGNEVAATAEMPFFRGDAWQKARQQFQFDRWFGFDPDFVITISAPIAAEADDASFCALVEHELLHCAQAKDAFGTPRWNKTGPVFTLRGHDFEQFYSVVARYGAEAAGVTPLVEAASRTPIIAGETVTLACGNCRTAGSR